MMSFQRNEVVPCLYGFRMQRIEDSTSDVSLSAPGFKAGKPQTLSLVNEGKKEAFDKRAHEPVSASHVACHALYALALRCLKQHHSTTKVQPRASEDALPRTFLRLPHHSAARQPLTAPTFTLSY